MSGFLSMTPALLPLLLAVYAIYNGPGHSLHWLSLSGVILFFWIARSVWKQDFAHFRFAWGWLSALALLYLGWLAIAPQFSTYPYASWTQAAGLAVLPLAMLGWMLVPDNDKKAKWDRSLRWLFAYGVILAAWGLVQYIALRERAHGPLIDANAYAALINLFLVPSAFAYLVGADARTASASPRLLLMAVAVFALALASTLSRGALVAFVAVLPLLIWTAHRHGTLRTPRVARLIAVLVASFMIIELAPLPDERARIGQLLTSAEQMERDQGIQQRLLLWRSTWEMIGTSNPVVGSGIGTFVTHYPEHRDPDDRTLGNHAHNDYLQALFEGGVLQLGFFIGLTIVAPLLCLYLLGVQRRDQRARREPDLTPGLLIGVTCIAVHAFVNFIHFVAPIAFLTGLYLARAWEEIRPRASYDFATRYNGMPRSRLLKVSIAILIALPFTVLIADGAIFKLFSTDGALMGRLTPTQRVTVLNTAIALRPGNPIPRLALIRHLVQVSDASEPKARDAIVRWAEAETQKLERSAHGTALTPFFQGKLMSLRGDAGGARVYFETAVRRAPHSTMMRMELTRLYRQLGRNEDANQVVNDAKRWLHFETSMPALAEFAREAQVVTRAGQQSREVQFWSEVEAEAERLAKRARRG